MKYAIVDIVWCKSHGIEVLPEMRTSTDQSKVILHEEFLSPFGDEEFPKYESSDPEFIELLSSEEWTYPEWEVGIDVVKGHKYQYGGDLWEVLQGHKTQENWKPSLETASLWKRVDEEHAGTKDDPIPYAPPMEIFKDKYYTQSRVLYKCIRDSGQPLSHNLSDLVGNYVEKA